jgi:hypothetical protein
VKKTVFFIAIVLLLATGNALAAPFLVCDPQPEMTSYVVNILDRVLRSGRLPRHSRLEYEIEIPAQGDGSIKWNLLNLAEGLHLFRVKACRGNHCGTWSGWYLLYIESRDRGINYWLRDISDEAVYYLIEEEE